MRHDHFMSSEKFYELKKIYENAYFLLPRKAIIQYKKVLNQGYLENEIYQYLARCYYEIHDYKNALKYLDQYIAVMHDDDSINCNVQLNKFKILIALNNKNKIIEYIKYISISNCVSSFKFRNSLIKEILSIKNIKTRLEIIDLFIEYLGGSDDNEIVDDLFFNKIIILNKLNRYEEVVLLIDCKYKERYKNEYTKAFIGILTKLYKAKKYSQSIALLNQKFYLFDYDYVDDFNTIITNIFEDNLILDDQFIAVSNKCLNSNYVNNKLKILILIRQHSFYKDIKNDKPNAISAVNHALQILPDNSYLLFLKNHYYRKSLTMKKQKEKGDLLEKAFKYEEKQNIDKAIKFYEKILKIDDTDREIYRNIIRLAIQNNTISTYLKIVDFWITKNKNDNLVDFYPYSVKLQLLFDNKETELMLKILDDLKHDINYKEYQNEIELWYFYIYRDLLKDNKKNMPYILGFKFDNKFELLYRKKLSYADNYKINKILVQLNKTKNIKRKIKYIEKILEIDNTDNYRGLLLANLYFKNKDYSKSLEVINQFIVFLEKSDVYVSSLLIQKMYIYKAIGNIEEVQIIKKVLLGETNFIEPLSDSQRQFIKDF